MLFSITATSHCFSEIEIQALGRPINDWHLPRYTFSALAVSWGSLSCCNKLFYGLKLKKWEQIIYYSYHLLLSLLHCNVETQHWLIPWVRPFLSLGWVIGYVLSSLPKTNEITWDLKKRVAQDFFIQNCVLLYPILSAKVAFQAPILCKTCN